MSLEVTPNRILDLGLGFFGSKALLSAVELGLFTELAERGPLDAEAFRERLGLHERSARDFFDALVALGMLERDAGGRYRNTAETDAYLDRNKTAYMGGMLEMANARLYPFWGDLTEALKTGEPQNEAKHGGGNIFETIYSDEGLLRNFLGAMTGISTAPGQAIAESFPWDAHQRVADLGAAEGRVPVTLARTHPHLEAVGMDRPEVRNAFEEFVARHGVEDRVSFRAGDFFRDELPEADVYVMGHILHDWGMAEKKQLLERACRRLPKGGALIVYEHIIDDERARNHLGLLMSLNMLIETREGFDYTGADCCDWMREVGFSDARVEHLTGPVSMVVGVT